VLVPVTEKSVAEKVYVAGLEQSNVPAEIVKLVIRRFVVWVRVPPVTDTAPKSSGVALSVKLPVPVKVIVPAPFVNVPADESQLPATLMLFAPALSVPPPMVKFPPTVSVPFKVVLGVVPVLAV